MAVLAACGSPSNPRPGRSRASGGAVGSRPAGRSPAAAGPTVTAERPPPWQAAPRVDDPGWLAWHRRLERSVPGSDPRLLFVGDSITQAWPTTGAALWQSDFGPLRPANLGVAGDTTQNVLWRLDHGEVADIAPEVTVVMIGTNNLRTAGGAGPAADIARGVEAVVADLGHRLPTTAILLLGVLPIGPPTDPMHSLPREVDSDLAAHDFGPAVHFLDLRAEFSNPDGSLVASLYRPVCIPGTTYCDQLVHPSAAGYEVMDRAVVPVLRGLLGSRSVTSSA